MERSVKTCTDRHQQQGEVQRFSVWDLNGIKREHLYCPPPTLREHFWERRPEQKDCGTREREDGVKLTSGHDRKAVCVNSKQRRLSACTDWEGAHELPFLAEELLTLDGHCFL